jgi:hypothetical protein
MFVGQRTQEGLRIGIKLCVSLPEIIQCDFGFAGKRWHGECGKCSSAGDECAAGGVAFHGGELLLMEPQPSGKSDGFGVGLIRSSVVARRGG